MHTFRRSLVAALALVMAGLAGPAAAETIETFAKQAIIVDFQTGTTLLEKNADELMVPSSMSKLMTAYLVFDKLKEGSWKMDDMLPVSETAWKRHYKSGGSLMFLPVNSSAKVGDLIRGVIIQSGNDACSVLAEAHSGSEEAFAEEATRRARDMGMRDTTFRNASGWPEPDHLTTARDLSILARRLITDFPEFFPIYSEKEFVFNGIRQGNRNPLLYGVSGADGLKTGHTEAAGYGLVGTVKRGDRR
ncbi:MAG: D-alanyl-D-alanine carboxypeptidase family protein, partial [Pseudomonadota bacterium]